MKTKTTFSLIAILVVLSGCASNQQANYSPSDSADKQDNLSIMMTDIRRERGISDPSGFDEKPYGATATSGR